ncbi:MAG: glycosyltransferase family 4 protein [Verrucomicrobiota bacterium JB022]|nr:glycosyltransferase family 4 protein [Verrucomicrobiota bacterium JB022]
MKVLLLVQGQLDRRLGGPRLPMDLASGLRAQGVSVAVESADTLRQKTHALPGEPWEVLLGRYVEAHGSFDVLDFDHLPFPLDPAQIPIRLSVARVSLLLLHLADMRLPDDPRPLVRMKKALQPWRYRWQQEGQIRETAETLRRAGGVMVNNHRDAARLGQLGLDPRQVAVVLPGCVQAERAALEAVAARPKARPPVIAFVGTFDFRKGCLDLVKMFERLSAAIPGVRLRLLGTKGLFQTEAEVRGFFPARLRAQLEVHPQFSPEALPGLLADASLGLFPSYLESFGYGALEMMHAGLPVLAYDVPGPSEFVPHAQLFAAGDVAGMVARAVALLKTPDLLPAVLSAQAGEVQNLSAEQHAARTLEVYAHWLRHDTAPHG